MASFCNMLWVLYEIINIKKRSVIAQKFGSYDILYPFHSCSELFFWGGGDENHLILKISKISEKSKGRFKAK